MRIVDLVERGEIAANCFDCLFFNKDLTLRPVTASPQQLGDTAATSIRDEQLRDSRYKSHDSPSAATEKHEHDACDSQNCTAPIDNCLERGLLIQFPQSPAEGLRRESGIVADPACQVAIDFSSWWR